MTVNFQFRGTDLDTLMIPRSYLTSIGVSNPSKSGQISYDDAQSTSLWLWGGGGGGAGGSKGGGLGQNNSILNVSSPVQTVSGGTNWKSVFSSGTGTVAAIKLDGTLWLWGNGTSGEMGDNTTLSKSSPVQTITGGTNWVQVAIGVAQGTGAQVGAIKNDGTLWMWGLQSQGSLGTNNSLQYSSPVQTVAGGTTWKQVSCGQYFSTAVKNDGTLWTWGYNYYGALGDNTTLGKSSPIQTISLGTNWSMVSAGYRHTGAVKNDGTLWMWGNNTYGQLGNNATLLKHSSPVQTIAGGTNWKQVSCGTSNTSAIKADGTLWMWGSGQSGVLGNNATTNVSSPVQTVSGGTTWWKVQSCGSNNTVAIKTDGTLWTWGLNTFGQLGNSGAVGTPVSSPIQTIAGGNNWRSVGVGAHWYFGCLMAAIKDEAYVASLTTNLQSSGVDIATNYIPASQFRSGNLWGWGRNDLGQLGDNTTVHKSSPVQTVAGGANWTQVVAAADYSYALNVNSQIWTWGNNPNGQLGNNSLTASSSPGLTFSGSGFWKTLTPTSTVASAIQQDGRLWVWGTYDQLVAGYIGTSSVPVVFPTTTNGWKQVAFSFATAAGIDKDGRLWCWGNGGSGSWGNGAIGTFASSPIQTISQGTNWKQVSSGYTSVGAIKTDGTLWLWGKNANGQLGDGTNTNKSSPVQTIAQGTNWRYVALNAVPSASQFSATAAIKTDGTLWTWGQNNYGQLGDSTTTDKNSPVQTIAQGSNWLRVAVGSRNVAAIKNDGTLWVWGKNNYGQLGDGTTVDKSSPVQTLAGGYAWANVSVGQYHILATQYT